MGDDVDLVRVGDVVLILPDDESIAADKRAGYKLGVNMVEVSAITGDREVQVSYLFASTLDGPWESWPSDTSKMLKKYFR